MRLRGHYEKPSEKRTQEKAEAIRCARKLARKRAQREGLLPGKPKPPLNPGARAVGGGELPRRRIITLRLTLSAAAAGKWRKARTH
jgi:small subunit ribosomal protein S21